MKQTPIRKTITSFSHFYANGFLIASYFMNGELKIACFSGEYLLELSLDAIGEDIETALSYTGDLSISDALSIIIRHEEKMEEKRIAKSMLHPFFENILNKFKN